MIFKLFSSKYQKKVTKKAQGEKSLLRQSCLSSDYCLVEQLGTVFGQQGVGLVD